MYCISLKEGIVCRETESGFVVGIKIIARVDRAAVDIRKGNTGFDLHLTAFDGIQCFVPLWGRKAVHGFNRIGTVQDDGLEIIGG